MSKEIYDVVIGLEVHAQLLTSTKIFCGCSTDTGLEPNTNTCPVCMGMPGVLPVLNKRVVDCGIKLGHATNCRITEDNIFARKNYFYPDLPKGYQITQFDEPICTDGYIDIDGKGHAKRIRINRIHMEEDAGKNIHDVDAPYSYVDYNRAGVPLLEIVTEPDISSTDEAVAYLKDLRQLMQYLNICDGNMEQGSLRCDANVSVMKKGAEVYGTRTELKNMNSFRNVQKALEFEIERHIGLIESGGHVVQETRLWNASSNQTFAMRSKEESHDYRYFPEPDLVPIVIDESWIAEIVQKLPELPREKRQRFMQQYSLPSYDADVLTQTTGLADYFEQCAGLYDRPKEISNWIMTEVLRAVKDEQTGLKDFKVTPGMLAGMLVLIRKGTISGKMAKDIFEEMLSTGKGPEEIVKDKGLAQISGEEELKDVVACVLEEHPAEVNKYRQGKTQVMGFLVGQVMKATKGRANPKLLNEIVKEMLS